MLAFVLIAILISSSSKRFVSYLLFSSNSLISKETIFCCYSFLLTCHLLSVAAPVDSKEPANARQRRQFDNNMMTRMPSDSGMQPQPQFSQQFAGRGFESGQMGPSEMMRGGMRGAGMGAAGFGGSVLANEFDGGFEDDDRFPRFHHRHHHHHHRPHHHGHHGWADDE